MKVSKKIIIIIIALAIIISILIILISKNEKKKYAVEEYQPEEEISMEQERKTIVSLYFRNKTTKTLEPEARLIDVKDLVNDPYKNIMNLLIEGPKKDTLEKTIPNGTIINNITLQQDMLVIDFSKEFVDNHKGGKEEEEQTIESIVKTLTELAEIDSIKILIDGEENKEFNDQLINFSSPFIREE